MNTETKSDTRGESDPKTTQTASSTRSPVDTHGGYEELLEDFFGLNIRSFRSLRDLIIRPAVYFDAARKGDWNNSQFTPSQRLWLGLMAIMVATRFLWGNPDSTFMQSMEEALRSGFEAGLNGAESPPEITLDWNNIIERIFDLTLLIQPFVMIATIMVMATFIRFWGERLPYITRLRYLFAIIVPATLVNLIITMMIIKLPMSAMMIVGFVQMAVLLVLYALTAWRGPFRFEKLDSAIPKSIMLAVILFIGVMLANFIAQIMAMIIVILPEISTLMAETPR